MKKKKKVKRIIEFDVKAHSTAAVIRTVGIWVEGETQISGEQARELRSRSTAMCLN